MGNDIVQPCFVYLKRIDFKLEQKLQLKKDGNIWNYCSKNVVKSTQADENLGVFGTINFSPEEEKVKKLATDDSVLDSQSKSQGISEFQKKNTQDFLTCCNYSTSPLEIHNKDKKRKIIKSPKEVPINIGTYEMIRPCSVCLYRINLESCHSAECINSKSNITSHDNEPTHKKAKLPGECNRLVLNKYCKSFIRSSNNNLPPQLDTSVGKCNSLGSRQLFQVPSIKNSSNNLKSLKTQKYSLNNVESSQVPFSVGNSQVNPKMDSILPLERTPRSDSGINFFPYIDANSDIQLHEIVRPCSVRVLRLDKNNISKEIINQHSKIRISEKALASIPGEIDVKTIAKKSQNTCKSHLYNTQQNISSVPAVVDSYHENRGVFYDNYGLKLKLKPCCVRIERFLFEKYASETTSHSFAGEEKRKLLEVCDPPIKHQVTTLKYLCQKEKITSKILELKYDKSENKLKTSKDTLAKNEQRECDKIDVNFIGKSESIEFLPRNTGEFGNSNCVTPVKETTKLPCIALKKIQFNGCNVEYGGIVKTARRKCLEESNVDSENNSISTINGNWCKRNVEVSDSFFQRTTFENSFRDNGNIEQEKNLIVLSRKTKIKRHICVQCYAFFPSAKALYNHICNGKSKKGYLCQFCEKLFKTNQCLQTHMISHIVTKRI